jgi:hypothetical protein
MRYFIVTYVKKPDGQMDELIEIGNRVRSRDTQMASVILDFKQKSVLKSSLGDTVIPREWQRIRDFYYQHYERVIDQLEKAHNAPQENNPN